MRNIFLMGLTFIFLCYSCEKEYKVIDGTSKETFTQSVKSISSKLTILQQDKIQEAVKLIYKFKTEGSDEDKRWEQLYTLLNGKNAEQIFDMAEEIAKKNKIPWTSISMNSVDPSVFDKDLKPLTEAEQKLKQIEKATRINLRYAPINKDDKINDGFYLYPELIDDSGAAVSYTDLPLNLSISFINNGNIVYVIQREVNSSQVGNPSLMKGIKIYYSLFDNKKLFNSSLDVEIKIKAEDKYLYGKLSGIPIDLSKTRDASTPIEDEINKQVALDNVKKFIRFIGNKQYSEAYNLTQNPKWISLDQFSSTTNGFGTIDATNLINAQSGEKNENRQMVNVQYQIKDINGKVKTLTQNFILKKVKDNWLITNTVTKEIKEDTWK
ncbi:hypothetical protein Ga0061079_10554 [Apibacter mensalis]|uniref:NTF2-like N-terminal transpeptidase domain-containing protein n=1 Tax=Apibacter mensalis TaxID=1586267 RepID=A0A0X3APX5_9FLAO|nr:hypothetical protein [Apibacter mensalis]CVK16095.1 hypothetical protein Ga0061079_10554 [Apibacter mensalis]